MEKYSGPQSDEDPFRASLCQIWEGSQYAKRYHVEKSAKEKWKIVIRMILGCITWKNFLIRRMELVNQQYFSFMQTDPNRNLMFDLDQFRANKNCKVHPKVKYILSLPAAVKRDADLHFVQTALQDIQSFSEYPLAMQRKFCQLGWYQGVEAKRIILKEGQRAATFYFILSGTVVITQKDKTTGFSQTKCMIQRGMAFGELAIINPDGLRTATVLSKTFSEMLCIDAQDFKSIFICGGLKAITDRDVISFLCNLRYLQNFPFHKLDDQPHAMLHYNFRRGQVLVKDSNHSDWIYIVKSGSISVVKKLLNKHEWSRVHPEKPTKGTSCTLELISHTQSKLSRHKGVNCADRMSKKIKELKVNSLHKTSQVANLDDRTRLHLHREHEDSEFDTLQQPRMSVSKAFLSRESVDTQLPSCLEESINLPPLVEGKPTAVAQLDNHQTAGPPTIADLYPEFVHVQLLERGQTFGMIPMLFENQSSFSAISNGADCVLISKQFYMQHVSNRTLEQAYIEVSPYPDDAEMEEKLQEQINWSKYKRKHYNHYIDCASRMKEQLMPRATRKSERNHI